MPLIRKTLTVSAIVAAAMAFSPVAEAKHRGHHHTGQRVAAAPTVVPAHQRPEYVGVASASLPGVVDLGLGPVFPFGGWPN